MRQLSCSERLGNLREVLQLAGGEAGIQSQQSDLELHVTNYTDFCRRSTESQRRAPVLSGTKGRFAPSPRSGLLCSQVLPILAVAVTLFLPQADCAWIGGGGSAWGPVTTYRVFSSSAHVIPQLSL